MKFIKKNKTTTISFIIIGIIVLVIVGIMLSLLMPATSKSPYGKRNKDEVVVSSEVISKIEDTIKGNANVSKVTYYKTVRMLNFDIELGKAITHSEVLNLLTSLIPLIPDDVKGYYDIQSLITIPTSSDNQQYPVFAYKSKINNYFKITGRTDGK